MTLALVHPGRQVALRCVVACALVLTAIALPYRLLLVTGGSMAPTFRPGDVLVVQRGASFGCGDVVLVDHGGDGRVVHRVVRANQGVFITRGDANPSVDRLPVRAAQIRGTVVGRIALGTLLDGWITRVSGGTLHNQSHR